MNSGPTNPTDDASALPPDERMRQHGARLMMAVSATLRVGKAYAQQNQLFQNQIDGLLDTIGPVLQQNGEAVIVVHDADLYLNGVRVPVNQSSFKFQQSLIEQFRRVRISGLRFQTGVTGKDLGRLFDLLLRKDGPTGAALMDAVTAQALRTAGPILHATLDRAGLSLAEGFVPTTASPGEDNESIAPQIQAPRIESPEVLGRRRHAQAVHAMRLLLMPASQQTAVEVRHAKRVVQPLVEGVSMSEPVFVRLPSPGRRDEVVYAHAVSVCAVAVAIGHRLGLDRRALSDLGVAALLHDVGKTAVAGKLANSMERFTPEERAAAERHPIEGAKLLARSTSLNPTTLTCIRAALEHHATGEGGYPVMPADWRPSLLSQIVAVADCFVSLQSRASQSSSSVSPSEALGMMLGSLSNRFLPVLLWALVRAVGFYPAGQIVEMDDGGIAAVLAPNANDPARPHVRIVMSWNGAPLPAGPPIEMRPVPSDRFIARALKLSDYPEGVIEAIEDKLAA